MKTIYQRGDILLASVEFSGSSGSKYRPVVVLSTETYNQAGIKLIGAAITSNLDAPSRPGDVFLNDWAVAGLTFPSAVRGVVVTVDRIDVRRILGVMSSDDFANVERALISILGF
jgi:mRNA-degrading endonuclease toxin of MazEF toxin-antitoxin module